MRAAIALTSAAWSMFHHPFRGHLATALHVVHDEDQLMLVIAVLDFDVHAGRGHPAGELPELAGLRLTELLDKTVSYSAPSNPRPFERVTRGVAVLEQEVGVPASEHASSLDAHAGPSEGFAHLRERAGPV